MDDNVSMLIEGMIVNAKDALWSPYYQLTHFDLEASEGVQRDMMLEKLDALDKRSAELRELISTPRWMHYNPATPDNDTVSRLAAADAEIAADQDFDKKGHEREYKIGPEAL